jgi:hypothetical protein
VVLTQAEQHVSDLKIEYVSREKAHSVECSRGGVLSPAESVSEKRLRDRSSY